MVDFWGLFGSALTVAVGFVGVGIMIWYEIRKQNSKFKDEDELEKLYNFMRQMSLSQIHKKIAMLNNYLSEMPWANKEIAEHKSKKIASDIRAVSEIKSILSGQQKEELRKVRDKLIEQMAKDYDVSEIKVVFEELFST